MLSDGIRVPCIIILLFEDWEDFVDVVDLGTDFFVVRTVLVELIPNY